ncbi:mechanosensitive ion channel family protein [Wenyingzhuangia sp. 2_MG-2023]|uniref:mechanosensitive ion channel family protein n=1 Tax=Wenyingzhuangia sp. 2_MG-2023 TaxID=3062639 RepID=UPI0026E19DBA|nr:mechanosensitive ion channel domain-containing protein [Wenyingzhuangia sp. 2_MG-2023]MDO6738789.1 mechanosensitive ion channel [Wenyingzhuangia sp. 2_MG-2023]
MGIFNISRSYEIVKDKLLSWTEALISMLPNIVLCIVLLILFYFIAKLVRLLVQKAAKKISHNQALTNLLGTISFLIVLSIGIFVALSVLKLDKAVTSLLAGAGVIGLALSFAFQDSATNFISGVFMAVRKPFRIGDVIETADEMGIVKQINLRNILMHSFNGQEVIIPNKDVFQNKIRNYSSLPNRRIEINCGVAYDSDLEKVIKVGESTISALDFVNESRGVDIFFNEYAGSSINFTLYFWIDANDQPGFLKARNDAIIALKKAFDENNIGIPFPIRTLDINTSQWKEVFLRNNGEEE